VGDFSVIEKGPFSIIVDNQAVSEERLKELAAKLGAAGPLSDVIVAERGRN
jgi:hypothetical protein